MKHFLGFVLIITLLLSVTLIPVEAADNIAIGKTQISGAWSGVFVPERAFDGNYDTIWAEGGNVDMGTKGGYSKWIGVDLGEQYSIEKIIVATRRDVDQTDSRKGWLAQVTNDPKLEEWVTIDKKTTSGSFKSLWEVPCNLNVGYRYVRIASAVHIAIAELEVYGEKYEPSAVDKMSYTDIDDLSFQNEMNLLYYIGLAQKLEKNKNEFGPYQALTRGRAAEIIAAMMNSSTGNAGGNLYFADVAAEHPYSASIGACVQLGVISAGGSFRPDDHIQLTEFLKMMVYALGYGQTAERTGGYPGGVLILASSLRLNKGIAESEDGIMNHGDAARIILNALKCDLLLTTGISDELIYKDELKEGILQTYFGLTSHEGIVTANNISSLNAEAKIGTDNVYIDSVCYTDKSGEVGELLSKHVVYYTNEEQEIVCCWEYKNEVLHIEGNDIVRVDMSGVEYYEGDKKEKAAFRYGIAILKNGVAAADVQLAELAQLEGFIELVDNDEDGEYDALFVYKTTLVVVEQISFEDKTLKLASQNNDSMIIENVERLTVFLDGQPSKVSKLSKGYSFYLSVSDNGNNVRIDASSKQESGVVSGYSEDDMVIGGKTILLSDYYKKNRDKMDAISIGSEVVASLDKDGKAAWLFWDNSIIDNENIGYITAISEGEGLNGTIKLKVFTAGGEFKILELLENVKVDGISYKNNTAMNALGSNYFKGKFMLYTLSDGKISSIDSEHDSGQEKNSKMNLKEITLVHNALYMVGSNGIYLRHYLLTPLKNKTTIFFIPMQDGQVPDEEFDSNYKVYSTAETILGNNQQLYDNNQLSTIKCFGADEFDIPQFAAVFKEFEVATGDSMASVSSNAPGMVVDKVVMAMVEDEVTYKVYGYDIADGRAISIAISSDLKEFYEAYKIQQEKIEWLVGEGSGYYIDSSKIDSTQLANYVASIKALKCGDVIRYSLQNNVAIELDRIFDSNFGDTAWTSTTGMFYSTGVQCGYANAQFRLAYGSLTKIKNGYIRMSMSDGSFDILSYSGSKVFVFSDGKIRKGNVNDLLMYSGSSTAHVLAHQQNGAIKSIIIYE